MVSLEQKLKDLMLMLVTMIRELRFILPQVLVILIFSST